MKPLLLLACLLLAACEDPNARVAVGNREYRTLPTGDAPSWPSSGTSNGESCVAAPQRTPRC